MKTGSFITYFVMLLALAACATRHDPRVEAVFALAETTPEAALDSIDAIDTLGLSKPDRMLLSLAKIKASDKSDKPLPYEPEILRLVDYYSSHENSRFYPTALYYAGRVYCESGDSPTALRYYQDALDLLNETIDDKKLKCCVLIQLAYTLSRLHLTDESIPYYEQAIELDSINNDTVNLIYDLADYAESLRWAGRYDEASGYLNKSICLANKLKSDYRPVLNLILARIKIKSGDIDGAISLIENAWDKIEVAYRFDIMTTAARAYYLNQNYDSVYAISRRIIAGNSNDKAKRIGYYFLSQNELEKYSSEDSIKQYHKKYLELSERILKKFTEQSGVLQSSLYNYSLHDRKRREAEKSKDRMFFVSLALAVAVLALISTTLYFKNRSKSRRIKLGEATENIRKLKERLNEYTKMKSSPGDDAGAAALRDQLRKQLIEAAGAAADIYRIPSELTSTQVYSYIRTRIEDRMPLPEQFSWVKLQDAVNSAFPEWKQNLNILGGANFTPEAIKTMLLIKCGCSPSELALLLSITKGSVSSRRAEISKKLLGDKYPLQIVDAVIRLL